ncbi:sensor histidine kinase [Microbispora hainanensis]|uniref:histidine kinase n=1 Tax=Microbispora hainanensis TaxID=568844 RepID=A0A544YU95_9ACTN|nr:sensor histidine kinase [Microbispora hainanensis]TQS20355.1 sensor histidine kinase [Microbispora hainanensis]
MTSVKEGGPHELFAGSSRRWVRLLPGVVAIVLCVCLLPATSILLTKYYGLIAVAGTGLAIAQVAPLLLAVVRPLQAWYVIFPADVAGALALLTVDFPERLLWPFPSVVIVGYVGLCLALGLSERRRTLLLVWLATAAANVTLMVFAPHGADAGDLSFTALGGLALLVAVALRERAEVQRRLVEQETISEAERARRTLLEERARIARELHDVVAHHMSVITVQADSAEYRLDRLPPEVREEFANIASTARNSLGEMRRLLGVLRNEETHDELAPQPGLAQIDQLVDATSRAHVPVEFTPCDVKVPESVGLSAYRIVQEALANVVRHAPGARTQVCLSVSEPSEGEGGAGGGRLTVLIVNGPSPEPRAVPLESSGTGQGLVGMRERVRLVGGTLEAGPLPDGGFRVAARLPLNEEDFT